VRRVDGGATVHYRIEPQSSRGSDHVRALVVDDERIWIGHDRGLIVFKPDSVEPGQPLERHRAVKIQELPYSARPKLPAAAGNAVRFPTVRGSPTDRVLSIHRSTDGGIWIGSRQGLTRFDGENLVKYETAQRDPYVGAVTEDVRGHIWLAGLTGALKLTRTGFVTYSTEDGLPPRVRSLFESRSGDLVVSGWPWLLRFDGERFIRIRLNLSSDRSDAGVWAPVLQTRTGEWWAPGSAGLYRFPSVATLEQLGRIQPAAIYTTRNGLAFDDVCALFEDSSGNVWIAPWAPAGTVLARWNRATGRFDRFTDGDGLPPFSRPLAFAEDRAGGIWVGFWNGGVARYRHGRFTLFTASDGAPVGPIGHLHSDAAGRLWIGSSGHGVARVDAPDADRPHFVRYTTAQGLSSDFVTAITEDRSGRIYLGSFSDSGAVSVLDRLEPETGSIRHYTLPSGFQGAEVEKALCDRHGTLWFSTSGGGLVSLVPSQDDPSPPPSIYIGGVRVAGTAYDVSAIGETGVTGLELEPDQNHLEIDYFTIAAAPPVRYQYRLEGADREWSEPTAQHRIHYAQLSPGSYQFLVRAIAADGQLSVEPASVAFHIAPPFWRRSWFLVGLTMIMALAASAVHRIRVTRLIELERVRTRIATDLHDDIGSSLTQIAILTEVAQRRIAGHDPAVVEPISRVSSISRELVDSMGEIVWAINPRNDRLQDLAARMRRFAADVLTSRRIALRFHAPDPAVDVPMSAEHRRQCFLVFKEAIHNAVRHASCSEVAVEIVLVGRLLAWTVSDNGKGFDARRPTEGHGLRSMEARARALGGCLEITSRPGKGAVVRFAVALDHRAGPAKSPELPTGAPPAHDPVSVDGLTTAES
jgi:signal transduction histidine kinase/streptogramin lyase